MPSIVLVAFGVMGLGWLCRRTGVLAAQADRPFNDYLYYIAMPALILDKLTSAGLADVDRALLAANALPGLLLIAGLLFAHRLGFLKKNGGELLLCSALGNTVYLGFPLTAMRFGEDAVSTASVVTSVQNLTV
ncbi:MAG: AEC family transporter, partial [Elusimicrobiota bacterium]